MRDDTALLVKVRSVSSADNHVCEEYEYDSENRIIKKTENLPDKGRHEYVYEYRVIGVEE